MNCSQFRETMDRVLDGEGSRFENDSLQWHLRECDSCVVLWESRQKEKKLFEAAFATPEPPAVLVEKAVLQIGRAVRWRGLGRVVTGMAAGAILMLGGLSLFSDRGPNVAPQAMAHLERGRLHRESTNFIGTGSFEITAPQDIPIALGDRFVGMGEEGSVLSFGDLGSLRVPDKAAMEIRRMNWKQFGSGIALGSVGVGVLAGTVQWNAGSKSLIASQGGELVLSGSSEAASIELAALEAKNRELEVKLEESERRLADLGDLRSVRDPLEKEDSKKDDLSRRKELIQGFVEKFRGKVPIDAETLNSELLYSNLGGFTEEQLEPYRAKLLALIRLHESFPDSLEQIILTASSISKNAALLLADASFADEIRLAIDRWSERLPHSAGPHRVLARLAAADVGAFPASLREGWYLEAVRIDPSFETQIDLAKFYGDSKDFDRALDQGKIAFSQLEKKVLSGETTDEDALGMLGKDLGDLYVMRNDTVNARRCYEAAKRGRLQGLNAPYVEEGLGRISLREGDLEQAFVHLRAMKERSMFGVPLTLVTELAERGAHKNSKERRDLLIECVQAAKATVTVVKSGYFSAPPSAKSADELLKLLGE